MWKHAGVGMQMWGTRGMIQNCEGESPMNKTATKERAKPSATKPTHSGRFVLARAKKAEAAHPKNGVVVLDEETGITAHKENVKRLRKFAEVFLPHLR
jgi:hypothetical protein